jgi:hypothetical protein
MHWRWSTLLSQKFVTECDYIVTAVLRHNVNVLVHPTTSTGRAADQSRELTDPYPPPFKVIVLRYISSTHHRKILSISKKGGEKIKVVVLVLWTNMYRTNRTSTTTLIFSPPFFEMLKIFRWWVEEI